MSIGAAFVAKLIDGTESADFVPSIARDSVETLLSVMASSMLVMATLSVSSMVSAYASAGSTATPRSFALVVSDDASQNALSTFVGAFIFSIVALTALKNDFYESAGLFVLFLLTVFVFGLVIVTFLRWVDRIARLGRMASTIEKVEQATTDAMLRRSRTPTLRGAEVSSAQTHAAIYAEQVGFVQHVDISALHHWAEDADVRVRVDTLPGTFVAPGRPLAYLLSDNAELDLANAASCFQVGKERMFDDDPRFGLVVLAQIAGRALSPGVNDPGTAIDIVGTMLRLFMQWHKTPKVDEEQVVKFDRVEVPEIPVQDMFEDAFGAIARDGAATIEVVLRLQKVLQLLAETNNVALQESARHYARLSLARSEQAMTLRDDIEAVKQAAKF